MSCTLWNYRKQNEVRRWLAMGAHPEPEGGDEHAASPWSASTILHATPVGPALVRARRRRRRAAADQAWRYRIFGEAAADSARVCRCEREDELRHADEELAEASSLNDDMPPLAQPGPPP